ncbi:hypothetical protein PMIN03_007945 [Paraphaeosphaeria minitans]
MTKGTSLIKQFGKLRLYLHARFTDENHAIASEGESTIMGGTDGVATALFTLTSHRPLLLVYTTAHPPCLLYSHTSYRKAFIDRMATPRVLLSSAIAPEVNNWIPPSYARDHEKLVCVAKEIFAGDITGDDLEVHFHLAPLDIGAMTCTARLVPQFWNRGDYFTSDFTMTDELHLYAHIELRTESTILANTGRPTFYQSVMEPASFKAAMELLDMQPVFSQPHRSQGDSINQHQLGESVIPIGPLQPLDLSFWESPSTELEVAKRQPELENEPRKKSKRKTRAELESESESEPIGRRTRASKPAYTRPIPEPALYPTLPVDATPENLLKDKEAYRSDNTRDEFLTTGRDISSFCKSRKDMIAKARLQAGKYGVVARKPCDHCESRKKSCRVFHPALYHEPFITNIWWKKSVGSLQTRCACCTAENKVQCNFCY